MTGFTLKPALHIACDCCDGHMGGGDGDPEDHEPNCPRAALQRICCEPRELMRCPKCGEREVEINTDDFFECRKCSTRYTRGIAPGHDVDKLKKATLLNEYDMDFNAVIGVAILPEKGQGKFRFDKIVEPHLKQVKEWRARKAAK